jgi:hypothetical protein
MLVRKFISVEFVDESGVNDVRISADINSDNTLMYVTVEHESKNILTANIL